MLRLHIKQNTFFFFLSCSLFSNVFLWWQLITFQKNSLNNFSTLNLNNQKIEINSLKSLIKNQLLIEGNRLPENTYVIDSENKKVTIIALFSDSPKLVFYIPSTSCNTCFEGVFNLLRINLENLKYKNQLIFLTSSEKFRDLKNVLKENNLSQKSYALYQSKLNLSDIPLPIIFFSDSTLILHKIFIPENNNLELADWYLDEMNKYF